MEGVGVYDSVNGEVMRHDVASEFGLSPNGLVWVGDRLWFSAYSFLDSTGTSARGQTTTVWSPADGDVHDVPVGRSPSFGNETATVTSVVEPNGHGVDFYTPDGARPRSLRIDPSFTGRVVVSPDQERLAVVLDPTPSSFDGSEHALVVLTPDGHGGTVARRVPDVRTNDVLAWRDDRHLVVWTHGHAAYQLVDVDTGRTEDFITPGPSWVPGMHLADDAWSAPTYDAPAPPTPLDPRLVTASAVAVLVFGLGALLLWRRRVRP